MRQRFLFEDSIIKNLKYDGKRLEYFDKDPEDPKKGSRLCIRVGKRSKKWFVAYQINGRRKRYTIGTYPQMTLRQANKRVAEIMVDIGNGIDPALEIQQRKQSPVMNDLWAYYQQEPRHQQKSEHARKEENRKWNKEFAPTIGDIKIQDISRSKIKSVLMKKAAIHPVMANRLHSLLNGVFDVALDRDLLQQHPMYRMKRPGGKEAPKKRFLDDIEIGVAWRYFETLKPNQRDVLKLILLTAQRPGEVQKMRWHDIDFDQALWTQLATKTGNTFLVPLSVQVAEILKQRKESATTEYVFPCRYSNRGARPMISPIRIADIGIEHFSPHDLRRTARTLMSRLQIKHHIMERVLNHAVGGIQAVYDQFDYLPEKKSALQLLADEITKIIRK